jgi:hypothetical protein
MHVGRRQHHHQGNAVQVRYDVVFAPGTAAIYRVGPGTFAPLFACMIEASIQALDQSIFLASCRCWRMTSSSFSHTPACCQSRSLRQQVIPLPHPISCGKSSQGIPVLSTKMIPVSAARSGTGGRPPFELDGLFGNMGSIISHIASLTSFRPILITGFILPYFSPFDHV